MSTDSAQPRVFSAWWLAKACVLTVACLPAYLASVPVIDEIVIRGAGVLTSCVGIRLHSEMDGSWNVADAPGPASMRRSMTFGGEQFRRMSYLSVALVPCTLLLFPSPARVRLRLLLLGVTAVLVLDAAMLGMSSVLLLHLCADSTSASSCRNMAGILSPWSLVTSLAVCLLLLRVALRPCRRWKTLALRPPTPPTPATPAPRPERRRRPL